ncbi:hypothetical protein E2C01_085669 [Portunus trituberculatus]|uniref:Uncharacterized protein n=1 Tax=Portunus trituberculatus TaxID=210409 RepID=A0A5B7J3D5_PORTR|nr:hypothetical protein [Portunus trituberculatus]
MGKGEPRLPAAPSRVVSCSSQSVSYRGMPYCCLMLVPNEGERGVMGLWGWWSKLQDVCTRHVNVVRGSGRLFRTSQCGLCWDALMFRLRDAQRNMKSALRLASLEGAWTTHSGRFAAHSSERPTHSLRVAGRLLRWS